MTAIAQMQPASLLAAFQAFLPTIGVELFAKGFDADKRCLIFSSDDSLINNPPTHTSLYVPHLTPEPSPLYRYFVEHKEHPYYRSKQMHLARSGLKPLKIVYTRMQETIDSAIAHLVDLKGSYEQVSDAVRRRFEDGMTVENLLYSAVLLSSLIPHKESIVTALALFDRAARKALETSDTDGVALLTELAYAAHKKSFICYKIEDEDSWEEYWEKRIEYAKLMIRAWSNALPAAADIAYDPVRIFAGLRACLASQAHYEFMIPLLQRLSELYPHSAPENHLRMAWARLAFAVAIEENAGENCAYAAEMIRRAIQTWEHTRPRSTVIADLRCYAQAAENTAEHMYE